MQRQFDKNTFYSTISRHSNESKFHFSCYIKEKSVLIFDQFNWIIFSIFVRSKNVLSHLL